MEFLSVGTGFLIDFISTPVTSGFTSAYSVIIIASQLKSLFGLRKFKAKGFVDNIRKLIAHFHETRIWDTTLGICCILLLLILRVSFSQQLLLKVSGSILKPLFLVDKK
jgi:sodium-independent sulfate anion transporter 11